MAPQNRTFVVGALAEFEQFFSDSGDIRFVRRKRLAKIDEHPIGKLFWPFRKITAALKEKIDPHKAIKPHRDDRRIRFARNQFVTTTQSQQSSGAAKLAFWKKTDYFARANLFGGRAHCVFRATRRDWNATRDSQDRMQNSIPIIFLIDDETDPSRTSELEHDCVDKRNMIRQKQKTAGREVLRAERLHAINQAADSPRPMK